MGAHDGEFDDGKATRQALDRHARDECDSRCSVEADQSFQDWVVRRLFCVAELGSKVDATRSVAVLANGLLAVRMAKTVARDKILRVAEQ